MSTTLLGTFAHADDEEAMATRSAASKNAVRQSWQTFSKDPANVASLRKAVEVMKSRDNAPPDSAEFRTSWAYWANIHGYFGPQSPFGPVANTRQAAGSANAKYFKGITDTVPPDQLASEVWANCQHGTPWFFAWHRLYLFYFEKQLQKASGNPKLRLPYWDYTDPVHLAMPQAFSRATYKDAKGKKHSNPLFESRRAPGWGNGRAKLDGVSTNIDDALDSSTTFTEYQDAIEGNVHGYIHCTVAVNCPVADMGAVPYSSNDPIFWVHHANIDRLWNCWRNVAGHSDPSDANFVDKAYSFVDTDGNKVTSKVGDLFTGKLIDYKYQQETRCQRASAVAAPAVASRQKMVTPPSEDEVRALLATPKVINAPTQPLVLTKRKSSVRVDFVQSDEARPAHKLALFAHPTVRTQTRLILRDISFQSHPGALVNVYLQTNDSRKKVHVGTLSFFTVTPDMMASGAEHAAHHEEAASDAAPAHHHQNTGIVRDFDVTDAMRQLGADSSQGVTVGFEASNGRTGDADTPTLNEAAKLTVGSIEFQVRLPNK